MKTLIKSLSILLIISSFNLSFGQTTSFNLNREISMNSEDSETKSISLEVKKKTDSIAINIFSKIRTGNLTIEILNQRKEKIDEFTIECLIDDKNSKAIYDSEIVTGQISKFLIKPESGKWFIKIIPTKTIGIVNIKTIFYLKD